MSGVATATDQLVQLAHKQGRQVRIAATRKTLPGLRYFEKRAVELGGGDTHRLRLDDMILIKDNHLEVVGSVDTAVKTAKLHASFTKKIEIEVTKPSDAVKAAQAGADIILLDNMPPEIVQETVGLLRKKKLRDKVLLEVSGGINIENIGEYLRTGIDIVSVGRITSSAHSIDMSFELEPRKTS
jgi:nicotinate-nucleotide pyrophosphorylase (carboxylating)